MNLRPGAESRFVFRNQELPVHTERVVLYLHGFSASPREAEPLAEKLAASWDANLFLPRYTGHGIEGPDGLAEVKLEDWQRDTRLALQRARQLGRKVVVIAMSTAVPLALHELLQDSSQVEALILLSPNFGLPKWSSELLLWPGGRLLARLVLGAYREWEPKNKEQAYYWTTKYPSAIAVEVMRAVDLGRKADLSLLLTPALLLYSKKDHVVDPEAAVLHFARLGSLRKRAEVIDTQEDHHVIAGNILSPRTTDTVYEKIRDFLLPR